MKSLAEWLEHTQSVHALGVDLGLDRVRKVAERLNLLKADCPIVIVGGTNGKGSTVAGLEAIYLAAGFRVGAFTTPYLYRHNEQVRVQGKEAPDAAFCEAFERIEAARERITLTQFEFNTLAALDIFRRSKLDLYLLEVGLGGRLDAVNIMDADVALITSIALDHTDWLGNTRDLIAIEKAGICRSGKPAVCGDPHPPQSLKAYVEEEKIMMYFQGEDFSYDKNVSDWDYHSRRKNYSHLPLPSLALQNMATVLQAVDLLQSRLPVEEKSIRKALASVHLKGRIQVLEGPITQIIDVSHNPAATALLAEKLKNDPCTGKTFAVFSMLADKDIVSSLKAIKDQIDFWYIAELPVPRGASIAVLEDAFRLAEAEEVDTYEDLKSAYQSAFEEAKMGDRLVIFGSFYTVSNVGDLIQTSTLHEDKD